MSDDAARRQRLRLMQMQARARMQAGGGTAPAPQGQRPVNAPADWQPIDFGAVPEPRGWGEALYDNIIGNPDDGVFSPGEALGAWMARAAETASLGLLGDESAAALTGLLPGRDYEGELARYRQNEENLGFGGRLSADLAGGILPALTGLGAVNAARTLPGAMARGLGLGATAGGIQGFMEGEGGFGDRAMTGALGAGLGGIIGGATPAAAALGRQGVRAVSDWRRGNAIGEQVGAALGVDNPTGQVLADLIGVDDPAVMRAAIQRAGPGAMLADVSPAATGTLDAVMRSPVPGARAASSRIEGRAAGAYDDIMDALSGGQAGPSMPMRAQNRAMSGVTRGAINDLYERAYATPIDYSSPAGQRIEDLMRRLPQRQAARAISEATDMMIYDGFPRAQIIARVADDGSVTFDSLPNVMQLDYIKRAFDNIAQDSIDPVAGRMTSEGAFASRVARDIRGALRDAVPVYGEALESAATDIRQRGAIRLGAQAIRPETTVEDVLDAVQDATGPELRAMRDGVRRQIEHIVGNVRAVASDQNIDARQAQSAFQQLTSPNAQRKLEAIFGDQWPDIQRAIDEGGVALGLRASTARNSATAGRQFASQAIDEATEPGAIRRGQPLEAARNIVGGVTGASPEAIRRMRADTRSQLADVLTRQGGVPDQAINAIVSALLRHPQNMNAGRGTEQLLRALGLGMIPGGVGAFTGGMN